MRVRGDIVMGLLVAAALIGASSSAAKEFGPGDLSVCDAARCIPIMNRDAVRALSGFYYTGPQPAAIGRPRWGANAFELRFKNGYVTGVAAGARLDRFLSFGVYLERFRRGTWYRLYPRAARELRRLTVSLEPLRVTPATVRRSR
jgi:hypothetical protein